MKKIIYVLTFLLSIISINVNAEDGFINVKINDEDNYLYGGEIKEVEGIRYDSLDNTLILENYKNEGYGSIYITNMNDLKIKVVGENTFNACGSGYEDFEVENTNLNIFGDGTLNLCGGFYSEDEIKIDVKDISINSLTDVGRIFYAGGADINIKNVKINVNNTDWTSGGIYAKNVKFEESSIKGTTGFGCLQTEDKLEVISSDVSCYTSYYAGVSIYGLGNLHIKDSNISMPKNEKLGNGHIEGRKNIDIENSNIKAYVVVASALFVTNSEIDTYVLIGNEIINISKDTTINVDNTDKVDVDLGFSFESSVAGKIINNYGNIIINEESLREGSENEIIASVYGIKGEMINNYGKLTIKNVGGGLTGTLVNSGELIMKDVIVGIYEGNLKYKDGHIRIDTITKDKCIEKYGEDSYACEYFSPLYLTEKPEIPEEMLTGNITEVCNPEGKCEYVSGTGEVDFKSEDKYKNFNFDSFIEIGKKEIPKEENNTVTEVIKDVANTIGVVNIIFIIIGMLLASTGIYILIRETKKRKI